MINKMLPIAVINAVDGAWALVVANLALSAGVALAILQRDGQLRRARVTS